MDQYVRTGTEKPDHEKPQQNEIRVTAQGKMRKYILYATNLLETKDVKAITLRAMGKAIHKTVTIAELIKRRVPGLHQITEIGSAEIVETYSPKQQGLEQVTHKKHVSSIAIKLSLEQLDTKDPGYQAPVPQETVKPPAPRKNFPGRGGFRQQGGHQGQGQQNFHQPPVNHPPPVAQQHGGHFQQHEHAPQQGHPHQGRRNNPPPQQHANETQGYHHNNPGPGARRNHPQAPHHNVDPNPPNANPQFQGGQGRAPRGRNPRFNNNNSFPQQPNKALEFPNQQAPTQPQQTQQTHTGGHTGAPRRGRGGRGGNNHGGFPPQQGGKMEFPQQQAYPPFPNQGYAPQFQQQGNYPPNPYPNYQQNFPQNNFGAPVNQGYHPYGGNDNQGGHFNQGGDQGGFPHRGRGGRGRGNRGRPQNTQNSA